VNRSNQYASGKARGWYFSDIETLLYESHGIVLGQASADSCVAACCRMLLHDEGIEQPEAFIRDALDLDEGGYVSRIPDILRAFGSRASYEYRNDLTTDDLKQVVQRGPAVVFLKRPRDRFGHALLVEEFSGNLIGVRDPLPEGEGAAYRIPSDDFLKLWLNDGTGRGQAAIVVK